MLDARYSHLYFCQSLNRLQRGLSAIADLLVFTYFHHISYDLLVFLEEHLVPIVHYSMKSFTLQLGIQQSVLCIIMSFFDLMDFSCDQLY